MEIDAVFYLSEARAYQCPQRNRFDSCAQETHISWSQFISTNRSPGKNRLLVRWSLLWDQLEFFLFKGSKYRVLADSRFFTTCWCLYEFRRWLESSSFVIIGVGLFLRTEDDVRSDHWNIYYFVWRPAMWRRPIFRSFFYITIWETRADWTRVGRSALTFSSKDVHMYILWALAIMVIHKDGDFNFVDMSLEASILTRAIWHPQNASDFCVEHHSEPHLLANYVKLSYSELDIESCNFFFCFVWFLTQSTQNYSTWWSHVLIYCKLIFCVSAINLFN